MQVVGAKALCAFSLITSLTVTNTWPMQLKEDLFWLTVEGAVHPGRELSARTHKQPRLLHGKPGRRGHEYSTVLALLPPRPGSGESAHLSLRHSLTGRTRG